MITGAFEEFKNAGGSTHAVALTLGIEPDTVYRLLAGERKHYDLEHALTQDIGASAAARVLAYLNGTEIDEREVWMTPKRCTGCNLYDFFPIHSESPTGRTLYLECTACGRVLQYKNQPARRKPQRPNLPPAEVLAAEYHAGAILTELGARYGVSKTAIRYRLLKHAKVTLRPRVPPRSTSETRRDGLRVILNNRRQRRLRALPKIREMHALGHNYTDIERAVGISRTTVKRILIEEGAA